MLESQSKERSNHLKKIGVNFLGILNDIKRRPIDAAKELGITEKQIINYLDGNEEIPFALIRKAVEIWPVNYNEFFNIIDDAYRVKTKLYNSTNGNIISENNYFESDIFLLADKLVKQLKLDLEIPLQYLQTTTDLPVQSITTAKEKALNNYIK